MCMQIRAVETAAGTDVAPHDAELSKVRGFESEFHLQLRWIEMAFMACCLYSGTRANFTYRGISGWCGGEYQDSSFGEVSWYIIMYF